MNHEAHKLGYFNDATSTREGERTVKLDVIPVTLAQVKDTKREREVEVDHVSLIWVKRLAIYAYLLESSA